MEYRVDDRSLSGETFLDFVQQVWPGAYNLEQTRAALSKTMNFTAWDGGQLAGCLRVLTDGCFFGTITELLVLPAYQRQGIGSRLLRLAAAHTPTLLYFGAQPGAEAFYEKNGCQRSLPSYLIEPKKDGGGSPDGDPPGRADADGVSIIPQRIDGVQHRGLFGGEVSEGDADARGDTEGHQDRRNAGADGDGGVRHDIGDDHRGRRG